MNRYFGSIGYAITEETEPGVWEEELVEREYYGDILHFRSHAINDNKVNGDFNIQNKISIIADPYAYEHFSAMRYLTFAGAKWRISEVEVQSPRLIISVGGLYHEQTED